MNFGIIIEDIKGRGITLKDKIIRPRIGESIKFIPQIIGDDAEEYSIEWVKENFSPSDFINFIEKENSVLIEAKTPGNKIIKGILKKLENNSIKKIITIKINVEGEPVQEKKVKTEDNIICSACSYENQSNYYFCLGCGRDLNYKKTIKREATVRDEKKSAHIICPMCNKKNDINYRFCLGCSHEFKVRDKQEDSKILDKLYEDAKRLVIERNAASASLLQRHLGYNYPTALALINMLEREGIIGPASGSKPRKVLVSKKKAIEENIELILGISKIENNKKEVLETKKDIKISAKVGESNGFRAVLWINNTPNFNQEYIENIRIIENCAADDEKVMPDNRTLVVIYKTPGTKKVMAVLKDENEEKILKSITVTIDVSQEPIIPPREEYPKLKTLTENKEGINVEELTNFIREKWEKISTLNPDSAISLINNRFNNNLIITQYNLSNSVRWHILIMIDKISKRRFMLFAKDEWYRMRNISRNIGFPYKIEIIKTEQEEEKISLINLAEYGMSKEWEYQVDFLKNIDKKTEEEKRNFFESFDRKRKLTLEKLYEELDREASYLREYTPGDTMNYTLIKKGLIHVSKKREDN